MKLTVLAASTILASTAAADEALVASAPRANTFGADAIAVVPVGRYANVANAGVGVLSRLEFPAGPGFVTGRAGVILHAIDAGRDGSLTLVPLYGGYRYPLGTSGAYIAGELGVTIEIVTVDTPYGEMSEADTELGLTLMAGLRRGVLDFRAGLLSPDTERVGFLASAGYDFAVF